MKTCIFYHCLLRMGDPPVLLPGACDIVREQMAHLEASGLLDACEEFIVGLNDNEEGLELANLFIPAKSKIILNGLASHSENLTIVTIEQWAQTHPGWAVLYFHSKGASRDDDEYARKIGKPWRDMMMQDTVLAWQHCVGFLQSGTELVCSRFMTGMVDGTQNIVPGNFWWARSSFLATLPSIRNRARIKISGIGAPESRWEAEVWVGNGPRLPSVIQFRPHWDPRQPHGMITA